MNVKKDGADFSKLNVSKLTDETESPRGNKACMGKLQSRFLLKLFISGNENCHNTDTP